MALTYDDITAITRKHFRPTLVDNIFNDIPMFRRFQERDTVDVRGGEKILQPVLYATTEAVGSYSGYDTLSTTPTAQITAAEYDWKQSYANITIDGLSQMKNSGPEAVLNLLQKRVQAAQMSLKNDLSTQLYSDGTGNSSKDITGLQAAIDNGDNVATYGGIARASYPLVCEVKIIPDKGKPCEGNPWQASVR